MISIYKYLFFLVFLSCDNDTEKTDLSNPEIPIVLNNQLPAEEKPLELVWSDEFDEMELNLKNWSVELDDCCPGLCG